MSDRLHFRCASCGRINRIPAEAVAKVPKCGQCGTPLDTSGAPMRLDDAALEALVARSPVPVLVDFYADWCGPCKALAPVLDQLGREKAGALFVVEIDTERHQRVAGQLGVRGIPALYLYKGGRVVKSETGARPLPFWRTWVESA